MKCSNISHAIGVVSGHMEKPSKYYGNGCLGIVEARVSPTMVVVIYFVVMLIHEIMTTGDLPNVMFGFCIWLTIQCIKIGQDIIL
jgi:hypothetical protein